MEGCLTGSLWNFYFFLVGTVSRLNTGYYHFPYVCFFKMILYLFECWEDYCSQQSIIHIIEKAKIPFQTPCHLTRKILAPVRRFFDVTETLLAHSLDRPFLLAKWAAIVLLDPQRHAAVVERMVTFAPNYDAVLTAEGVLLAFRLAAKARICTGRERDGWGIVFFGSLREFKYDLELF